MKKKKERIEATRDAIAALDFIEVVCGHVASGGTLTTFCADRDILFKLVNQFIQSQRDYARRYMDALKVREVHLKEEIIQEIAGYLRCDLTDAFDANGNMLRLVEMPRNVKRLIAGYEFEEIFEGPRNDRVHVGNMHKIKLWDKPRAIEMLMKHLKMLVEDVNVTGKITLADLLAPDQPSEPTAVVEGRTLQ